MTTYKIEHVEGFTHKVTEFEDGRVTMEKLIPLEDIKHVVKDYQDRGIMAESISWYSGVK